MTRPLTLEEIGNFEQFYKEHGLRVFDKTLTVNEDSLLSLIATAQLLYAVKEAAEEYRSVTKGCENGCQIKGCATFDLSKSLRPFQEEPK